MTFTDPECTARSVLVDIFATSADSGRISETQKQIICMKKGAFP